MIADLPKPGGFASLISSCPKRDSVPLGRVLRGLADRLSTEAPESVDETLELFLDEHERYANATRIASLSSAHALKAWAAFPASASPMASPTVSTRTRSKRT